MTCSFPGCTPHVRALFQLLPCQLPETAFGLSVSGTELTVPGVPRHRAPFSATASLGGISPAMPGAHGEAGEGCMVFLCSSRREHDVPVQQQKGAWCPCAAGEGYVMFLCRTACTLLFAEMMGCSDCSRFSVPGTALRHWSHLAHAACISIAEPWTFCSPERMATAFWQWDSTCVNSQCTQKLEEHWLLVPKPCRWLCQQVKFGPVPTNCPWLSLVY